MLLWVNTRRTQGAISVMVSPVAVRVIRKDEEQTIAHSFCRDFGLGMAIDKRKFDRATNYIHTFGRRPPLRHDGGRSICATCGA